MYLFIDTETTGLPKKRQDAEIEAGIWPDIVSIAWILTTSDGTIVTSFYTIILPTGWIIPADSTRIHGITTHIAETNGLPLRTVLGNLFCSVVNNDVQIVAHNMSFDKNVIINALKWRLGMDTSRMFKNTFCTMEAGRSITKLPGIGRELYRCPKLSVLYSHLFGKEPNIELHNALNDAFICMKIYFKIKNLPPEPIIQVSKDALPPISSKKLSLCLAETDE
jgi:DNA polymerase III epsilon subunit-like protein